MLRAALFLCLLVLLPAQEQPDDDTILSIQDPLQARLAAAKFDREHRQYERDKLRKEEISRAQEELKRRAEGGDGYDDNDSDEDDLKAKTSSRIHSGDRRRGRQGQQKASSALFASLERSYTIPPGEASDSSSRFFLPDPSYKSGSTVVIKVPYGLASEAFINATMRTHGCSPRRDMALKAQRGEAEERLDASRARDDKLLRLKGEAIKESYLEGKRLSRENKRAARVAGKNKRAMRAAAEELQMRRQQNSPEEKERQRIEQLKRLVLIDARFGTVGQVSSDNDPEKRRDKDKEREEAEELEDDVVDPLTAELFSAEGGEEELAFRDRAAAEARVRGEEAARQDAGTPTAPLGAPCEVQLCGACKVLVEEFASLLQQQLQRRQGTYVAPLLDGAFCASPAVAAKHTSVVVDVCSKLLPGSGLGYREVFVWGFVGEASDSPVSAPAAFARKEQVCTSLGACLPVDFSYAPLLDNAILLDSSGGASGELRCMVCERFAEEVQERISLLSTEALDAFIAPAVGGACERLQLPPPLDEICLSLLSGRARVQAEVFVRALRERMQRQERDDLGFARRLCADLKQCARAGGAAGAGGGDERKKAEKEMMRNAVYF